MAPAEGIGSFPLGSGGDQKPPLCPRAIKEKRDAYIRRLNEIYENNLKKVRTWLRAARVLLGLWPLCRPRWLPPPRLRERRLRWRAPTRGVLEPLLP